MKEYYVLIGNFGSGKTELSLNFALAGAKKGQTVLVDLDIINPYFRSSERKELLQEANIRLISPVFAMTNVEVPSLRPDVYSAFVGEEGTTVFDVGGDPTGAIALGQYKPNFDAIPQEHLHVLYVINVNRPFSSDTEQVVTMLGQIQRCSRLNVTGLVNNANLAQQTSAQDLHRGYQLVKEVSEQTGIPVVYTSAMEPVLRDYEALIEEQQLDRAFVGELLPIVSYMHRDWDRFTTMGI